MQKKLTYKKYTGSVEYSEDDGVFFGKILYIRDLVLYEADSKEGLQKSFENAVDEYLTNCKELGHTPDSPCSGTFNVRVGAEMHLALKFLALRNKKSLNEVVCQACEAAIESDKNRRTFQFSDEQIVSWKSDGYQPKVGIC